MARLVHALEARMGRYVIRRLLQTIPVLLGTTLLIFAIVFALPGDPIQALAGEKRADPNVAAQLRDQYHLDDPLLVQYGHYISGILRGDFGETFTGRSVTDIMTERIPVTFNLALVAFTFEVVLGLIAGVLAALRRGSFLDNFILVSTLAVVSVPVFVSGYVLQLLLGVKLQLFPVAGIQDGLQSYLLPGFVLAAISLAFVTRLTRTNLMESVRADYVRTAVAKGLRPRRVVVRHALRNSLIPVVTFVGADLGALMGGAIITERIFNLPGVGSQLAQSVILHEGPVVVGIVTALVLVYLLANLIVDLLYAVLDPRIRYD
jgi:oligopeptide transport system permease protein